MRQQPRPTCKPFTREQAWWAVRRAYGVAVLILAVAARAASAAGAQDPPAGTPPVAAPAQTAESAAPAPPASTGAEGTPPAAAPAPVPQGPYADTLFGDWGGLRLKWLKKGMLFNFGWTQFGQ